MYNTIWHLLWAKTTRLCTVATYNFYSIPDRVMSPTDSYSNLACVKIEQDTVSQPFCER